MKRISLAFLSSWILLLPFQSLNARADTPPPDAGASGIEAAKVWAEARITDAEADYAGSGLTRLQSPSYWGREIVYSIQVDRFNDGDPKNNAAPLAESEYGKLPEERHGGDLAGITARLDYLADLGVSALWLTPVFKHRGAYHGYCATDPTDVDPGFGSKEDLRQLVAEAHKRGIKVILDIVVNHLCDTKTSYQVPAQHNRCSQDLNSSHWNGTEPSSPAQGSLKMGDTFFPLFRRQEFFNRCGPNSGADTSGQGAETMFGDFTGEMFDYNTRNPDFQKLFTDIHKQWIAYADVDGFRLDAAKHVTEDYLAYFSTHIRDYARSLGKNNFYIVGEVAASPDWSAGRIGNMLTNPLDPSSHGHVPASLTTAIGSLQNTYLENPVATFPGMNASYDFILSGDSRAFLLQQGSGGRVRWDLMSPEHSMLSQQADTRLSWVVLEIHDWPRFTFQNSNDLWKSKLGLSYLATVEGIPVIYYGLEQGFTGICDRHTVEAGSGNAQILALCASGSDSLKRQDMFMTGPWRLGSTVPSIQELAYIGPSVPRAIENWQSDPMLARDHDVYKTARRFNHLRSSCSALYQGRTVNRSYADGNNGLLIYSRIDGGKEMVVVVNNTSSALSIPDVAVEVRNESRSYLNAVDEQQRAVVTGGVLRFQGLTIHGNSVSVFADEALLGDFNKGLGVRLCR